MRKCVFPHVFRPGEKIITIPIATWLAFHFLVFNTSFLLHLLRFEFPFSPRRCGNAVIVSLSPFFSKEFRRGLGFRQKEFPPSQTSTISKFFPQLERGEKYLWMRIPTCSALHAFLWADKKRIGVRGPAVIGAQLGLGF